MAGGQIEVTNGKKTTYKITSIGKLIDDALDAVEKENPKIKNVLDKRYAQLPLPPESLIGLINLIGSIDFYCSGAVTAPKPDDPAVTDRRYSARDILGHVYEYFLGQFALAEGAPLTMRSNLVLEKKYSERLLETLRRYHNRAIETAQVIAELIAMAKDFQAALARNEGLGLGKDEVASYDALAEKPEVLREMGDEALKGLAEDLTAKIALQHDRGLAGARQRPRQDAHSHSPAAVEIQNTNTRPRVTKTRSQWCSSRPRPWRIAGRGQMSSWGVVLAIARAAGGGSRRRRIRGR